MSQSADTFLLLTILTLLTVLLIFGMKYFTAARQTQQRLGQEGAYQELADKAAVAQTAGAATLAKLEADMKEMKTKLAGIERILREVE